MPSPIHGILCLIFAFLGWPVYFLLVYAFIRNRKFYPIKDRAPYLILASTLVVFFQNETWLITQYFWETSPCWLETFLKHFSVHAAGVIFITRAWKLYFNYNVAKDATREKVAIVTQDRLSQQGQPSAPKVNRGSSKRNMGWFVRWRFLGTMMFCLIIICAGCFLLFLLFLFIVLSAHMSFNLKLKDCVVPGGDALNGVYGIEVFCVLFLAWKMRNFNDNFFIKKELTGIVIVSFTALGFGAITQYMLTDDSNTKIVDYVILLYGDLYFMLLFPIQKISAEKYRPSLGKPRAVPVPVRSVDEEIGMIDFMKILKDRDGIRAFEEYLTNELSVECLLFWSSVEAYYTAEFQLASEYLSAAQEIMETYIETGAPLQVNLSFEIVQEIRDNLDGLHSFGVNLPTILVSSSSHSELPLADSSLLPHSPRYGPKERRTDVEAPGLPWALPSLRASSRLSHSESQISFFTPPSISLTPLPTPHPQGTRTTQTPETTLSFPSHTLKVPSFSSPSTSTTETHNSITVTPPTSNSLVESNSSLDISRYIPSATQVKRLRGIFTEAQREVFDLMKNDPYVRFCKTPQYETVARAMQGRPSPPPTEDIKLQIPEIPEETRTP